MAQAFVTVQNLTKKFGDNVVLENISFDVEKGKVLVLCGPSGCGKSTLLRCINGLEQITGGEITVDGDRITGVSQKELIRARLKIGMVFQSYNLFPHMTTLNNITLAPIRILKQGKEEASENAMRLLDMVGLREKASAYPSSLSGGQRQRVAIARALAMKPRLMLFDEPTAALDPEMKDEVLNVIQRLRSEDRMTMILVTHEIHFVKDTADQVMMIADRQIVESADSKTFFENPKEERTKQFLRMITKE
ncbi:MAG: amino acid ABC transporter ATP-binding protein [Deltaproteobacteria bacterium]|jgi:ABC-type polar amino acid transport system ATPase subunit|nr:MAG: amino acid ABC transporter ATP-binding protein [Deltaproteobacteria bacterium]